MHSPASSFLPRSSIISHPLFSVRSFHSVFVFVFLRSYNILATILNSCFCFYNLSMFISFLALILACLLAYLLASFPSELVCFAVLLCLSIYLSIRLPGGICLLSSFESLYVCVYPFIERRKEEGEEKDGEEGKHWKEGLQKRCFAVSVAVVMHLMMMMLKIWRGVRSHLLSSFFVDLKKRQRDCRGVPH